MKHFKRSLLLTAALLFGSAVVAQTVNYEVRVVALRAQGDNNDGGGFAGEQDPTWYVWARENILTNWNSDICTHLADDTWNTWNGVNIPLITGSNSNATQILIDMECWEDDCSTGDECDYDTNGFTCIGNTDDNKAGRAQVAAIDFRNDPACQWNSYIVSIDGSGSLPDYGEYFAEIEIMWEYHNVTAGLNVNGCGTSANLNGAGTGTWSVSSGPGIGSFSNTADPMATFTGSVAGTYTLEFETDAGCPTQVTDQVDVTLLGEPDPQLTADDPGCVGQTINYTAANGVTYDFQIGINGTTLQSGGNATFSSNFVNPGDTVYVSIVDGDGCTGTDFYVPDIAASPSISLGNDTTICDNETLTLDATQPFVSYSWSPGGQTTSTITVSSAGTYSVTITNQNNCSATDDIMVSTFAAPVVDLGNDTTICQGNPFVMDAGAGFASYNWSSGGTNQTETVTNFGTYTVNITDANGCEGTDDITLSPLVNNFQLGNDTTIYLGESITLTASGGSGYEWYEGTSTVPFSASGSVTVSPTTETTYTVNVLYPDGCYDIGTITISINDGLNVFVPNMFSPNGDGTNDNFLLYGFGIDEIQMRIFNRWGELVFESTDLDAIRTDGWDGTFNGNEQPSGTYVWTITGTTLNGQALTIDGNNTGTVLLRR